MNQVYDYIICGGGFSGLTQAYYLSKYQKDKKVLIIEPRQSSLSYTTFSYWKDMRVKSDFDSIIEKQWKQVKLRTSLSEFKNDLDSYAYCTILGSKYEEYVKRSLSKNTNVEIIHELVSNIKDRGDFVMVETDKGEYRGKIVFNSIYKKPKANASNHFLTQNIGGWVIETEKDCFDDKSMTMFDFSMDKGWNFIITLPYTPRKALVECVGLNHSSEEKLERYIREVLNIDKYEITYKEGGNTPMTDYTFPLSNGNRIVNIGKLGDMIKPSTGFTFTRVQEECNRYAKALNNEKGITLLKRKRRFFYNKADSLMLHLMEKCPDEVQGVFEYIFVKANSDLLFKFLDEKLSPLEWLIFCFKLRKVIPVFTRILIEEIISI